MRHPYKLTLTQEGDFISASYECLLCDAHIVTTNPSHAMMSICGQCAQANATKKDILRVLANGALHRARTFTNAMKTLAD